MDESATAYNAYLISRTGAGEFGRHFPLMIQWYSGPSVSYVNSVTIYLLAIVFRFLPPSILAARAFAAFWMFSACLLLGLLAKRISGRTSIGVIVGGTALLTPWFFEESRLVWDAHFVPIAVILFVLAAYHAQKKDKWTWREIATLAGSLAILTYGYFAGRVLAPLFALGLLFFATTRARLFGIAKVWIAYGLTLVPTLIFGWMHPGAVANRWELATYMKSGVPWRDSLTEFIRRYLEDQSVIGLLQTGHPLPRHHVVEAGGVFFFAIFAISMMGLLRIILVRRQNPWWRFALYGLAISIVPGAITYEPFHALRLLALPVFLLLITVPALEWFLATDEEKHSPPLSSKGRRTFAQPLRLSVLGVLLLITAAEAIHFQTLFRRYGPNRGVFFDEPYKAAFDAAVAQPKRPIYLIDGFYGPTYIDGLWYATVEGKPRSDFVHLVGDAKPPPGGVVITSGEDCQNCEIMRRSGIYLVYRAR